MKRRSGFTIVELMMVIGIIGILMTIVTTAASSSMKMSRQRKAEALCAVVQSGLATYYAQKDEWPVDFSGTRSNNEGTENSSDANKIVLTANEVRTCVKALVDEAKAGNPLIDISGLFVSRSPGERNTGSAYGLDFVQAVHGTKRSKKKMKIAEMYFGYPEENHGWFRRFKMVYSIPADSITVSRQDNDSK